MSIAQIRLAAATSVATANCFVEICKILDEQAVRIQNLEERNRVLIAHLKDCLQVDDTLCTCNLEVGA